MEFLEVIKQYPHQDKWSVVLRLAFLDDEGKVQLVNGRPKRLLTLDELRQRMFEAGIENKKTKEPLSRERAKQLSNDALARAEKEARGGAGRVRERADALEKKDRRKRNYSKSCKKRGQYEVRFAKHLWPTQERQDRKVSPFWDGQEYDDLFAFDLMRKL